MPIRQADVSRIFSRHGIRRQEGDPTRDRPILELAAEGLIRQAIADRVAEAGDARVSQAAISSVPVAHGQRRRRYGPR